MNHDNIVLFILDDTLPLLIFFSPLILAFKHFFNINFHRSTLDTIFVLRFIHIAGMVSDVVINLFHLQWQFLIFHSLFTGEAHLKNQNVPII